MENSFSELIRLSSSEELTSGRVSGELSFPTRLRPAISSPAMKKPSEGNSNFYEGDLKALVTRLKGEKRKNIFYDGGAEVVNYLLREKLFDELIISVVPVLLGDGIL